MTERQLAIRRLFGWFVAMSIFFGIMAIGFRKLDLITAAAVVFLASLTIGIVAAVGGIFLDRLTSGDDNE